MALPYGSKPLIFFLDFSCLYFIMKLTEVSCKHLNNTDIDNAETKMHVMLSLQTGFTDSDIYVYSSVNEYI